MERVNELSQNQKEYATDQRIRIIISRCKLNTKYDDIMSIKHNQTYQSEKLIHN